MSEATVGLDPGELRARLAALSARFDELRRRL